MHMHVVKAMDFIIRRNSRLNSFLIRNSILVKEMPWIIIKTESEGWWIETENGRTQSFFWFPRRMHRPSMGLTDRRVGVQCGEKPHVRQLRARFRSPERKPGTPIRLIDKYRGIWLLEFYSNITDYRSIFYSPKYIVDSESHRARRDRIRLCCCSV